MRDKKLSVRWTKHLKTKEEKEEFAARLRNLQDVFNALHNLLQEDLDASVAKSRSDEQFDQAAWPYKQAFALGEQKAINKILELLP